MYYAIATNKGKEKDAAARAAGQPMPQYAELAVGDGGAAEFEPLETQVSLVDEVWRGAINRVLVHPTNANWVVIEAQIPADAGPFDIREVGIYDSEGDLVIVASQALTIKPDPASGTTKDLYVRIICEITNAVEVVQQIDPTLVYLTQWHLDEHADRRDNPHDVTDDQIGATTLAVAESVAKRDSAGDLTTRQFLSTAPAASDEALHYMFTTATNALQKKTLANVISEIVTKPAIETVLTGKIESHEHDRLASRSSFTISFDTLPNDVDVAGGMRVDFINTFPVGHNYRSVISIAALNNLGITQLFFPYKAGLTEPIYLRSAHYNDNVWGPLRKIFDSAESNVGFVELFGGTVAPASWLKCDGAAVSRTTYVDLFTAIGTIYGAGDGSNTFNVPDCRVLDSERGIALLSCIKY